MFTRGVRDRSSLDQRANIGVFGEALHERLKSSASLIETNTGIDRVFKRSDVANSEGIVITGGGNDVSNRTLVSVSDVKLHGLRGVIGTFPEIEVNIEGAIIGLHKNLSEFGLCGKGPSSKHTSSLDDNGVQLYPDIHELWLFSHSPNLSSAGISESGSQLSGLGPTELRRHESSTLAEEASGDERKSLELHGLLQVLVLTRKE